MVIPVVWKLHSLLAGRPVKLAPLPTKLDAVTIPLVLILPSLYAVSAIPLNGPTPKPSLKVLNPTASTLATSS